MDGPERYTRSAIALHWLLALMIGAAFALGAYLADLPPSPARGGLLRVHQSAGISILALSAVRLLWRLRHRPPADVPMPAWQRRAARAAHAAMYLLFFAVPLAGWARSSAAGLPIVWFAVLPLPDLVPADRALADALKPVHATLAFTLGAIVLVHVAAALKHQLVDDDGLLRRMWPAGR